MRKMILTATLAMLCAPVLSSPAMAQYGQYDRREESPLGVTVRAASIHTGPDEGFPQVRRVARDTRVNIYGCLNDRSWCDVSYGNDRGWINGSDLAAEYQGRRESVATLSGSFRIGTVTFSFGDYWENYYRQRPFYNERYRWEEHYFNQYRPTWGPRYGRSYWGDRTTTGYTVRRAWMRTGPDYYYPRLRRIKSGRAVRIYGCLRDWSWCDVSYQYDRGWIPGRDIAVSYQGRRHSVDTIAPRVGIGILSFVFNVYWDNHYRDRDFYRERDRWERQYQQNYRPVWGPRQDNYDDRDPNQPRRDERQWQEPSQAQPPAHSEESNPPGPDQGHANPKPKPKKDKKPKPGEPGYVRPGESGPN